MLSCEAFDPAGKRMRIRDTFSRQSREPQSDSSTADALQRIARLQHIAMLQEKASQVIEAAEAALDQSLLDCPSLDETGDGSLRGLRKAH